MLTNDLSNHRTVIVLAAEIQARGTAEQQACFEEWVGAQMDVVDTVNIYLAAQYRYLQLLRKSELAASLTSGRIREEGLLPVERAQLALIGAHKRAEAASARLLEVTKDWLGEEPS